MSLCDFVKVFATKIIIWAIGRSSFGNVNFSVFGGSLSAPTNFHQNPVTLNPVTLNHVTLNHVTQNAPMCA